MSGVSLRLSRRPIRISSSENGKLTANRNFRQGRVHTDTKVDDDADPTASERSELLSPIGSRYTVALRAARRTWTDGQQVRLWRRAMWSVHCVSGGDAATLLPAAGGGNCWEIHYYH